MQAVILVGGEGTRLRPLTSTIPKPVVPLVDRPFIAYMLEWLHGHGVDDVIMSCGFLATSVRNVLGDGSRYGIKLRFVEEEERLGTAGPLKLSETLLDERFLMLNGDVLTDIDLSAQVAQHESTKAKATLALVAVADPTSYGLVRIDEDRSVRGFLEKPAADEIYTNLISAGAYVLERDVVDLIPPGRAVSIEREVWPRLVGDGLYAFPSDAYWLDIGTPERYLQGTFDILEGNVHTVVPPVAFGRHVAVDPSATIGDLVVLGDDVRVGPGSTLERAVVMQGTEIGADCRLADCIVAGGVRIGDGATIDGMSVIGEGVTIEPGALVTGGARLVAR
jgi:mannose-1-phosphate guanylyltransferase